MEIKAVELGQNQPSTDPKNGRTKFVVKVLQTLMKSQSCPQDISKIGICWFPDGVYFLCNAKILAEYLLLKPNSINTNFREHGFAIVDCPIDEIISTFGALPDVKNWKKRWNPKGQFNRNTTIKEAESIKCVERKNMELLTTTLRNPCAPISPPKVIPANSHLSLIPSNLAIILRSEPDTLLSAAVIVKNCDADPIWKQNILTEVTQIWRNTFGTVNRISPEMMTKFILQPFSDQTTDIVTQLSSNIEYLLISRTDLSQQFESVGFDDFLLFMIRYGSMRNIRNNLLEISSFDSTSIFDLSCTFSFPSQHEVHPRFQPWFHPLLTLSSGESLLKNQTKNAWVVRPSSIPNLFTVHCKICSVSGSKLIASHIKYDAISQDEARKFSIINTNREKRYAASWNEILFDVLHLKMEDALLEVRACARKETMHVDPQVVISNNEHQTNERNEAYQMFQLSM
ncbi:hypothetical protein GPJ56_001785 [Histomonas meleagridis]|uniref:uncharacterized protein n=1 Tax=Histomonas meleagridis TaxID=135588 RepID=UPI00355A1EB4|nr:hypothetical protein GPJ56_001785 [Histomonas meleagridis]KAH0803278.1 hypothetical protein GO595_004014 [Histomonas meleagridis]